MQSRASSSSSASENTLPVGLCGVLMITARVRGVNAAASSAGVPLPSGARSATGARHAARHLDVGDVGVVGRLEDDHLVAGIDDAEHGVQQQLGRAAGDGDFARRVDRLAVSPLPAGRERRAQARHARRWARTGCDPRGCGARPPP